MFGEELDHLDSVLEDVEPEFTVDDAEAFGYGPLPQDVEEQQISDAIDQRVRRFRHELERFVDRKKEDSIYTPVPVLVQLIINYNVE